ncbi:LacI family DNA-binding transcriptional regulator [Thalassococcus sp. S3]|uniref:LacI family DNA-binding transcriptional regulator n=1 Tax=Thalassococcus sp. S3 TaxID=2017482 RepID=UPI0010240DF1|nr:LacI family DNA-binding transcriptional regulator [Thalassococcus sp. S3]QBF32503.1 LacI family transcriptional regulator [Thalassococcus sp. S3]
MTKRKIRNMEEFAAVSGISRPTVSKYFNDPDSVRQSTRSKIEAALKQHEYRPNIFAINQNRKLTKNVGIVVPYLADPFFAEIARKIEQRCIACGYRPTLYSAHGQPELEIEILDSLRSLKPAGVLLAPLGRASDRAAVAKFCEDVPTVLFDSNLPGLGLAFVGSDNPQFSMLIVDYLCRTGAPPCFFEMKKPSNPNANKRREGYVAAMERLGHEPQIVQASGQGWDFEEIGRREGRKALETKQFATNTVLCSNDRLAIGFLTACYEMRLRVGRDEDSAIRVAGQDDHPFARFTCPPLTTIAQDYEAISRHAVDLLFRAVEDERSESTRETRLFEGQLIMRDSA